MFEKKLRYSFKNGRPKKIVNSPLFTLAYGQNTLSHARFGVVVSKKIDKRATGRNKIKRRAIGCIKLVFQKDTPFDFVLFLKKGIEEKKASEIEEEMVKALSKIEEN